MVQLPRDKTVKQIADDANVPYRSIQNELWNKFGMPSLGKTVIPGIMAETLLLSFGVIPPEGIML